jgi:hypothetical protein
MDLMRILRPMLVASLLSPVLAGAAHAQSVPQKTGEPPAAFPSAAPEAAPPATATAEAPPATAETPPAPAPAASGGLPPLERSELIAGSVGLTGAVTGALLLVASYSIQGSVRSSTPRDLRGGSLCGRTGQTDVLPGAEPQCEDLRSQASLGSSLGNAGITFLASGGLLVGAALAYWLVPGSGPKKQESAGVLRFSPVAGQGGGGFVVTGSF